MVKIEKIDHNITPFGGISLVDDMFKRSGLPQLIDKELGNRSTTCGYTYGNLIGNWFYLFLCGGDCAEDIETHLHETLSAIPGNKVSKADTMLRSLKELSEENTSVTTSSSDKVYQFNINQRVNTLLIKSLLQMGHLEQDKFYDFDYDNQILVHQKQDAKITYKKSRVIFLA